QYSTRINHLLGLHALNALDMCMQSLINPALIGQDVHGSGMRQKEFYTYCLERNEYYGPATVSIYSAFVYMIFQDHARAAVSDHDAVPYRWHILACPTHISNYMLSHCWLHMEKVVLCQVTERPARINENNQKVETCSKI